ncbi:MAG: cation-transporting P-type ATPase [Thermodesulfovibrionales bacterium]|jgi:Ca2+-transporting ATPase
MADSAEIKGLTTEEARKRLAEHGTNRISQPSRLSFWKVARHEVTEPMILLLLVVGLFYSIWGEIGDAVTIFAVIATLVFVEVSNEFRAKKAIEALKDFAAPRTRLFRDGQITEVEAEEVVPGDLLVLTPGTMVAADCMVETSLGIELDEAALTGESFPRNKDRGDGVYAGTVVVSGEGEAVVSLTGKQTRFGRIAATLAEVKPPKTPLQLAMKSLAGKLVYVALFFSVAIPILGIIRGDDFRTMLLTGLSLSFATIPEELPIVITMVLGLGAYRLSRQRLLIKKLKAAEALGNATIIVSDKTGTITEGRMRIASFFPPEGQQAIIRAAIRTISDYSISSLDRAIMERAGELGMEKEGRIHRQRNLGDGRKTKTVIGEAEGGYTLFMSGAPEEVFEACGSVPGEIENALTAEAGKGRRLIAVASRRLGPGEEKKDFPEIEKGLALLGLISFEDPPREGVAETISATMEAGIRTIMVTGDHPKTAGFVAEQVGIMHDNTILTGNELDALSDEELRETVKRVSVFSRAAPEHKYRIVKALQENGDVVAVTGDGVNDAIALKAADIGIAMGMKGTDVAKEAADIVIADDNYITITQGIFEGRRFFDNLRKGITYYLSVKVALILVFLLPIVIGAPMPFSPIHIIILELFMDIAASAGFVSEPKERDIRTRPPRNPKEGIITAAVIGDILIKGGLLFLSVMAVYLWSYRSGMGVMECRTAAFSAWIIGHIALAFVSRSDRDSLIASGIFRNRVMNLWAVAAMGFLSASLYVPFLSKRFSLTSLEPSYLAETVIAVTALVGLLEVRKVFRRKG